MENVNNMGVNWKIRFLGGGTWFTKNQCIGGKLPKKGGLDSLQI